VPTSSERTTSDRDGGQPAGRPLDISRLSAGDWMLVAGGAVMLVFGLALDWATIHANGRSYGGALDAFDYPLTGGIAWLLTVLAGVATFLVASGLVRPLDGLPWTRLVVVATMVATALMVLRLVLGGGADERIGNQEVSLGRSAGMLVAFLAAALALAGAIHNLRAEGGSVREIFSVSAWRRARPDGGRSDPAPLPPPEHGAVPGEPPPPAGR
jgi:hypothetical protein